MKMTRSRGSDTTRCVYATGCRLPKLPSLLVPPGALGGVPIPGATCTVTGGRLLPLACSPDRQVAFWMSTGEVVVTHAKGPIASSLCTCTEGR